MGGTAVYQNVSRVKAPPLKDLKRGISSIFFSFLWIRWGSLCVVDLALPFFLLPFLLSWSSFNYIVRYIYFRVWDKRMSNDSLGLLTPHHGTTSRIRRCCWRRVTGHRPRKAIGERNQAGAVIQHRPVCPSLFFLTRGYTLALYFGSRLLTTCTRSLNQLVVVVVTQDKISISSNSLESVKNGIIIFLISFPLLLAASISRAPVCIRFKYWFVVNICTPN